MTKDAHAQARVWVQARLDDRLGPEPQAWLNAHLAGCAACRRYAADLGRLERLLPQTFRDRWDRLPAPARRRSNPGAYLPLGGSVMLARQKVLNYAGVTLGLAALAVLLLGFAIALQTAVTPSRVPGQAAEVTSSAALTPPPIQFATSVRFGDAIALEGYSLDFRDGVVTVELLWHALAAPPDYYVVGVLIMPDGAQSAIIAQHDSVPAGGARPTSGWQPGEYVLDAHHLPLSPDLDAAQLVLWVTVYAPGSGERLASEPPGGGPFNAVAIGTLHMPSDPPPTGTPVPSPTHAPAEVCAAGPCTPTATPCQAGCPLGPTPDATQAWAATLAWTPTPIGFQPSPTPCEVGCAAGAATATASSGG